MTLTPKKIPVVLIEQPIHSTILHETNKESIVLNFTPLNGALT